MPQYRATKTFGTDKSKYGLIRTAGRRFPTKSRISRTRTKSTRRTRRATMPTTRRRVRLPKTPRATTWETSPTTRPTTIRRLRAKVGGADGLLSRVRAVARERRRRPNTRARARTRNERNVSARSVGRYLLRRRLPFLERVRARHSEHVSR